MQVLRVMTEDWLQILCNHVDYALSVQSLFMFVSINGCFHLITQIVWEVIVVYVVLRNS